MITGMLVTNIEGMLVINIAGCILAVCAYLLVLRYNLHMFQLNGYKNKEYARWLKKNWNKQSSTLIPLVLGILAAVFLHWAAVVLLMCGYAVIVWYFDFLRRFHKKKKLVYTNRVQRLLATDIVLNLLIWAAFFFAGGFRALWPAVGICLCAQAYLVIAANLINAPIERRINRHYIDDAKRMLKEVPGLKVIGITGSYGKTSVKYYLHTLLREKYDVLITPESYNTPMGIVRTIRESLKPSHEYFICEMGARHVGDIKEICDIVHPDYGMITSIGPQHLETFFSMENIVNTKFELADAVSGGAMFLNGDNEYIIGKSAEYKGKIFYRTSGEGEGYHTENIQLSRLGTQFDIVTPDGEREHFQMRLVGGHNVINVAGAIAAAHYLGVSLKELRIPVRKLQPVAHRMQMLDRGNVTIIDDAYNSNPVGSKAAVETLAMFEGVRVLVTPGMVELGEKEDEYNYKFGTYAAKCCDYIALVGRRHTQPILKGIEDTGFPSGKCQVFDKLEDALEFAYGAKGEGHKYILLENDLPDQY